MNLFLLCGILNLLLHHIAPDDRQSSVKRRKEKKERERSRVVQGVKRSDLFPIISSSLWRMRGTRGREGRVCMLSTKRPSETDGSIALEEKAESADPWVRRLELRERHLRDGLRSTVGTRTSCFVEERREGKAFRERRSLY